MGEIGFARASQRPQRIVIGQTRLREDDEGAGSKSEPLCTPARVLRQAQDERSLELSGGFVIVRADV